MVVVVVVVVMVVGAVLAQLVLLVVVAVVGVGVVLAQLVWLRPAMCTLLLLCLLLVHRLMLWLVMGVRGWRRGGRAAGSTD